MARFVVVLFIIGFSYQGTFSSLQNERELQEGFCENETKTFVVTLECSISSINAALEKEPNYLVQCFRPTSGNVYCHPGSYNKTHNRLEFDFTFNHVKHAGKSIQISSTCSNGTLLKESLNLLPCIEGFTATGLYNSTDACITCKHTSFKQSKGMSIIHGGTRNHIETCWWNKTSMRTHCHQQSNGHPDGIGCYITPYKPGTFYYCELDGQKVEVIMQEIITTTKDSISIPHKNDTDSNGVNPPVHGLYHKFIPCFIFLLISNALLT